PWARWPVRSARISTARNPSARPPTVGATTSGASSSTPTRTNRRMDDPPPPSPRGVTAAGQEGRVPELGPLRPRCRQAVAGLPSDRNLAVDEDGTSGGPTGRLRAGESGS